MDTELARQLEIKDRVLVDGVYRITVKMGQPGYCPRAYCAGFYPDITHGS